MKKIITIVFFISILIPSFVFAQFVSEVSKRGTTAAPFLNIAQGANATAMGGAFVATANDPSALYWNPAGIARLPQHSVMFDHTRWFADINYNFAAITLNLGGFGSLGASFTSSDAGDMNVTTVDEPNGTGETFSVKDAAFSIAWAYNLTDNFSIGFNPKVVYQSIWKMYGYAFAMDLGVLYNTPFEGITLGAAISNFGSKMNLDGTNAVVLYDDDPSTTGNNGRIPARLETESWDLPLSFRVGISYKPFISELHDLVIAVDAFHPNDNYESLNVGGEYTFNGIFSVRGGFKSLLLKESEESFTFGAGFKQYVLGNINIKFDYAYSDFGRLNNIQKFSVIINF